MECSFMSTIGMINSHEGEVLYITVIYSLDTCMLVTYAWYIRSKMRYHVFGLGNNYKVIVSDILYNFIVV